MHGPWLLLDTSSPVATVGVWREGGPQVEVCLTETRRHAEALLPSMDECLRRAELTIKDITAIGVGRGPGSFIGVRTGIATGKGLSLARGIPLVGIQSLLALGYSIELPVGRGYAVVDAKRGEVFAQPLERTAHQLRPVGPATAQTPAEVSRVASSAAFVVGAIAGLEAGPPAFALVGPTLQGLAAALRDALAHGTLVDERASLIPDYCRMPDARLPAQDPAARRLQFATPGNE